MGDFPLMTNKGTFCHQRHRACRRLAAGPLAGCLLRLLHRQDVRQGHLLRQDHPVPGCLAGDGDRQARHGRCPHRPQAQAVRHRPPEGARLDHRADPGGVRRVRVHARHPGEGPHPGPGRRAARHLPQAAPGRAADARGRADAAREPLLQPEALRPREGRPLQGEQEARRGRAAGRRRADHRRHHRDHQVPGEAARGRDRDDRRVAAVRSSSRPTTSTTSATVGSATSASSSRTRSARVWPVWSASSASA